MSSNGNDKVEKDMPSISATSRTVLNSVTKIPKKIANINKFSAEFQQTAITKNNAEKVFRSFLKENIEILGVEPEALELVSLKKIRDNWYIKFQQRYKGIPIHKATLGIDATNEGKMGSYSANYHPKIDVPTEPKVTLQDAVLTAKKTYEKEHQEKLRHKNAELIIYPKKENKKITYLLARKFILATDDPSPFLEKVFIVDAITGEIIESSLTRVIGANKIYGQVDGEIYPENPTDAIVTRNFEDEHVSIDYLAQVTTDETGKYEKKVPWYWWFIEMFFSPRCTFELIGPYAQVQDRNGN
ncbi:MAG: hypothetical protein CW716_11610, partial [Candidatus Bathyarchaeum sp.]